MTSLCTTVLADAGVLGSIDIQDFQLGFIPLDKEVLSLEYEDVYKRIYLVSPSYYVLCRARDELISVIWLLFSQDNDPEPIYDLAKALMTLQRAFGTIPRIIGKGSASRVSSSLASQTPILLLRLNSSIIHFLRFNSGWSIYSNVYIENNLLQILRLLRYP